MPQQDQSAPVANAQRSKATPHPATGSGLAPLGPWASVLLAVGASPGPSFLLWLVWGHGCPVLRSLVHKKGQ